MKIPPLFNFVFLLCFLIGLLLVGSKAIPQTKEYASAFLVVEPATRVREVQTALVLNADTIWREIDAKGIRRRFYLYDQEEAAPYRPLADQTGLPCLIILGEGGKVIKQMPLPKVDQLKQILWEYIDVRNDQRTTIRLRVPTPSRSYRGEFHPTLCG